MGGDDQQFSKEQVAKLVLKLTHYVCREHTDCEEGVELQERCGRPSEPAIRSWLQTACELLASRALVVSVAEKRRDLIPSGEIRRDERKRTADVPLKFSRTVSENRGK